MNSQKWFYRFGIIFFMTATVYFGSLLWRTYIWYNWMNMLEKRLYQNISPPEGPLAPDKVVDHAHPQGRFVGQILRDDCETWRNMVRQYQIDA